MIKLGQKVKDGITGFEGVVIGITEWINGCRRIAVVAQGLHEGKPIEEQWFDEQRLTAAPAATAGGPMPAPPRRDPHRP